MKRIFVSFAIVAVFVALSCSQEDFSSTTLDTIAESYVKLVLKVGHYDPGYVDAYLGPEEWKPSDVPGEEKTFPSDQLMAEVDGLIGRLSEITMDGADELHMLRYSFLEKQLHSVKARIELVSGKKMPFDEESMALYDVVAPPFDQAYYDSLLNELDQILPGPGDIPARLEKLRSQWVIPKEKIDTLFSISLAEARRRTMKFIALPANESVSVEYVDQKPWGAYHRFKGNSHSLIQINTDVTLYFDWVANFACHEAYPGHHVHLSLLEKHLMQDSNWIEFSVYPLFSPFATISEGIAEYANEIVFPSEDRIAFEKHTLLPLTGLATTKFATYYEVRKILKKLHLAENHIVRQLLDGQMSKADAEAWLIRYAVWSPGDVARAIEAYQIYGTYTTAYAVGEELVRDYIDRNVGPSDGPEKRWALFSELLSTPRTPSGLK